MPPRDPDPDAESSLALDHAHILLTSFNSFLTVAIHNILYYRNIYPPATFLSARAYNLPVHQNRHPKVCAWIRDAVDAVAVQLSAGHVERIAIVIHSPPEEIPLPSPSPPPPPSSSPPPPSSSSAPPPSQNILKSGTVLERWLIDTSRFPAWPTPASSSSTNPPNPPNPTATSKAMLDFARVLARDARSEDARERYLVPDPASPLRWPDLDEQLRGALRRMASAAEGMGPLVLPSAADGSSGKGKSEGEGGVGGAGAGGCTFTVAVELREEVRAPVGHPQHWIPSQPNLQPASKRGREVRGEDIGGVRTRPIRAVEAGPLFFECWVEESRAKDRLMKAMKADR